MNGIAIHVGLDAGGSLDHETALHVFSLIGGWPGALVAQRVLRHKTKKRSFQIEFWVTVILNCGALGWLFTSPGAQALESVLEMAWELVGQ